MTPWEKRQAASAKPWEKRTAKAPAPAPVESYDPSAGGGTLQFGPFDTGIPTPQGLDRFLSGAGKAFVDAGRGVRQIAASASPEQQAAITQEIENARELDAPLMRTKGGFGGNVAGNLAMTAPVVAIPGVNGIAGSTVVGGMLGALQPVTDDESRAMNTALGAVTSGGSAALLRGAGRLVQPVRNALTPADARAVRTLESAGVGLDAAQKSGSPVVQRIKSVLKDNPVTLGGQVRAAEQQQTEFNRAVLSKIGVTADHADEATMGQAMARIGQVFNDVFDRTDIRFSRAAMTRAKVIEARAARVLGNDPRISNVIKDVQDYAAKNGGKIHGRFYQTIRHDLANLEKQKDIGPIARELREGLDDAFQQAASAADGPALQEARRQWRNMRLIEGAIDNEGIGNISPSKLANSFGNKSNRSVGVYGKGDASVVELARIAKAGKRLLPDKLPQSGTAPRAVMQAAMPAAIGGLYGGAKEGDWQGAAMYAAGGALSPLALQRIINSPGGANYLTRGLAPEFRAQIPGTVRNLLMAPDAVLRVAAPSYLLANPAQ